MHNDDVIERIRDAADPGHASDILDDFIDQTKVESRRKGLNEAADIMHSFIDAMTKGHKIEAIMQLRKLTGEGLKEAKDRVKAMIDGVRDPSYCMTGSYGGLPPTSAPSLADILPKPKQYLLIQKERYGDTITTTFDNKDTAIIEASRIMKECDEVVSAQVAEIIAETKPVLVLL